ncbi:MAG: AarF/ABC1/UbiB kinase family protein [Ktedonobacteraceae bacterium]|nr:AarF/ABC1/UbiB kinase family protein [Ktedonobacteraceae bacterium]
MHTKTPRINRFSQAVRFLRVSRLLLWTLWVIYRERRRVVRARQRGNYEVRPNIEVLIQVLTDFRETALKLGVLMIKLGQFLSARADMLPQQALDILSSLQDEVPPAPFSHVVSVIETETGKPVEQIFSVLERKATAAASLGQVHKAVLASTGETVAVKIQRPHIEQLVRMDLSTLKFVIWVINRFVDTGEFIDLMGVYREFRRTVYEEIDYITEAANARRFKEVFQDDATIYIPRIYDEYTSRHMLVLEWIDGCKINDYTALEAAGIDRLEVATRTVRAYFYQFFELGFFHADPHPGNIFVKAGSTPSDPIIAFVDFGMVGTLTRSMKRSMRDVFVGFVARDAHGLVDALSKLDFIGEGANVSAIERGLSLMMEQYYGMTLGEARDLDMSEVSHEVEQLMYDQPFRIPAQFAFTGRAIGTLVGVATGLSPEFNFVDVATPYAQKFLNLNAAGIAKTAQEVLQQLLETSRVLMRLPIALEQVISRIDAGQVEVRIAGLSPSSNESRRRGRRREANGRGGNAYAGGGISGSLSLIFVFAASLVAAIFLMNAHLMIPGWFCLALAGLTTLGLVLKR